MAEVLDFDQLFYTAFEPKHQHRFIMGIDGIPSYMIKGAARPNLSFNPVEIDHINVKRKVKGKPSWASLSVTLYDPIVPSASQALFEWIRLSHEAVTGRDGYFDMYSKDLDLWMLGPVGDIVEHWILKGAWIAAYDGGTLDWASDSLSEIQVTLEYNYAILEF